MAAYICFLRGVNVGGKGKVPMTELKTLFEDKLGFENVKTLLQSGNIVFTAKAKPVAAKIEATIEKAFAYKSDVHVLTPAALRRIIEGNPFPADAKNDPSHTVALIISQAPGKDAEAKVAALVTKTEKFKITPQAVYMSLHLTMAGTKLSGAPLDRALGVRGTARNWNTLNKLLALAEAL
jgi:uncharacterized protein (DUF1697 family)